MASVRSINFTGWQKKLDHLCRRFLDIHLLDIPVTSISLWEYFDHDFSPEQYFVECLVPDLKIDVGEDFLNRVIAQMAKYGRAL